MKKSVLWTPVAKYHEIFYFFWFTCLKITITTQPLIPLPPFSMLFKAKGPGHMSEQHWKWGEGVKGIFWRSNFDEVKNPKNLTSDGQRCLGIFQNLTIFHATYKIDKIKPLLFSLLIIKITSNSSIWYQLEQSFCDLGVFLKHLNIRGKMSIFSFLVHF